MKNKKINRYKQIKDRVIAGAGGGLVAGMIFMGSANTVLADTISYRNQPKQSASTGMHVMRRWNSRSKIDGLVNMLGLDQNIVQDELKSGKSIKQILLDNGLDTGSLDQALNGKSRHKSWKKYTI